MALLPTHLQAFHRDLKGWFAYMERATGARVVLEIQPSAFLVTLLWEPKNGEAGFYTWLFEQPPKQKACQVARDIVRAVLEQRGVIT